MTSTVLVVEDEPAIAELISVNLRLAGHTVLISGSAENARIQIGDVLPDLILLDWMLPGLSGVDLLRQLRNNDRTRDIPVIMLTARSAEIDKISGLEQGADDYLTKPFSPKELNARIKAVMRRRAPQLTDDTVEIAGLRLEPASHKVTGHGKPLEIGPTEFRLLHFFMTHPVRVYSRAQLLDQVWGDHVFVEERTVDVHIRRLRLALAPSGHDALIETVRGAGYCLQTS